MTYRVEITGRARRDIGAFARYCRTHSEGFWREHGFRLADVLETCLAESPRMWSFFYVTGSPYRAYLFEVGERTKYWLVYSIDEKAKTIYLMRMWNSARNPKAFRV